MTWISPLVVGSWNIREALPDGEPSCARQRARGEIVRTILDNRVDALALQELDFSSDGDSLTLRRIAEETPLRHVVGLPLSPSSYFAGEMAGVGLACRHVISSHESIPFPNPRLTVVRDGQSLKTHDKGLLAGIIEGGAGNQFRIVSLHLVPYHVFKRKATDPDFQSIWSEISHQLALFADLPLIVCGDFNTSHRSLILDSIAETRLARIVGDRETYKKMAADDIMVTSQFKKLGVRLVSGFSDHKLCIGWLGSS